jgi:hypothetical protein
MSNDRCGVGVSSFHGVADSSLRQVVPILRIFAKWGPVAKPGRYKTVSVTSD